MIGDKTEKILLIERKRGRSIRQKYYPLLDLETAKCSFSLHEGGFGTTIAFAGSVQAVRGPAQQD